MVATIVSFVTFFISVLGHDSRKLVSVRILVFEVSIGLVSAVLMELSIVISGQRHAVHRFLMVNILIMFGKEMVYPGVMDSCFSSSCLTLGEINLF